MSDNLRNVLLVIGGCILCLGIILTVIFTTPGRVKIKNEFNEEVTNADYETNYQVRLQTEGTLRSYLASYESDRITYISNKDYTDKESQELARSAKTRANRTAATYNQLLQNSLLEHIPVPDELMEELEYIE